MKNKPTHILKCIAYYIAVPLIYYLLFLLYSLLTKGVATDLGSIMYVMYFFAYIAAPLYIIVAVRFSMLPFYIDPIAALEIPLMIYFTSNNESLGYCLFLFALGLICSISFKRKSNSFLPQRLTAAIKEYKYLKKEYN